MTHLARRVHATVLSRPALADATLALVLATAALVSVEATYDALRGFDPSIDRPATAAVVLSMLGLTLPLTWRRRFPFAVAIAVVLAFLVGRIAVDVPERSITVLAASLALYSLALHGQARHRTLVLAICISAILAEVVRELFFADSADDLKLLLQSFLLTYNLVVLSLPWILGAVIRSLREREQELGDRASELQREREENAREAVFAERVRIARELHDVVAHHVSVMGVQAGAARRVMHRQPEKAITALSSIEASSRQAVAELHRLLQFLRRDGEADALAPQPGLAQLGDLVAEAAQGDLIVNVSVEGERRTLSPTLEVSAYRVIQEALTNTRKHSRGATATVRIHYSTGALEVEVLDDGSGRTSTLGSGTGLGLIGMRERASLHGGHVRAGPRPEGGFSVFATFPLAGLPS